MLLRFPGFRMKALTLSYDDCVKSDKKLIEIMSAHGLRGTFNLNAGNIKDESENRITKSEALGLYLPTGNEVACHGYRHLSLGMVDKATATRDVIRDREGLEELFGGVIKGMAYANGSYNDDALEVLKVCGINYCRTTHSTHDFGLPENFLLWHPTCHHDDPELMALADRFLSISESGYYWGRKPRLFYLWGHSYEFNDHNNWDVIERFAEKMGGHDDVWYATNGEIYEYMQAFARLEFSATGRTVYNPSTTDIYLNFYGTEICVPAGKTTVCQ